MSMGWLVVLNIPFHMLDKVLQGFYLQSTYLLEPIMQLACAHMYLQMKQRKEKEAAGKIT